MRTADLPRLHAYSIDRDLAASEWQGFMDVAAQISPAPGVRMEAGSASFEVSSGPGCLNRLLLAPTPLAWACCTRPEAAELDAAFRLALLAFIAVAPGAVRICSLGSREEWAETARAASDLLGRRVEAPAENGDMPEGWSLAAGLEFAAGVAAEMRQQEAEARRTPRRRGTSRSVTREAAATRRRRVA